MWGTGAIEHRQARIRWLAPSWGCAWRRSAGRCGGKRADDCGSLTISVSSASPRIRNKSSKSVPMSLRVRYPGCLSV